MELRRYLAVARRHISIIVVTALATVAVVAAATYRATPTYSSAALVRIAQPASTGINLADLNYADRLMQTYAILIKSRPFLDALALRMGAEPPTSEEAASIRVDVLTGTELLRLRVESQEPERAAVIANTLAQQLVEHSHALYGGAGKSAREILGERLAEQERELEKDRSALAEIERGRSVAPGDAAVAAGSLADRIKVEEQVYASLLGQYDRARLDEALLAGSVSLAEPAVASRAPSKPNAEKNLALGAILGVLGGIGLALLFETLDPRTHSAEDIADEVALPLLGQIPDMPPREADAGPICAPAAANGQSAAAEAFRMLGVSTLAAMSGRHPKTLMLSSAEPGAGKSILCANLAVALAQAGHSVVLVDGDLHHPRLHALFAVPREPGLSDALRNPTRIDACLQTTSFQGVRLLAAGSSRTAQNDLYQRPSVPQVISGLAERADLVLWDSPPVLVAADAAVVAPLVQGVVLVAARDRSSRKSLALAIAAMDRVGAKLLGLVYNRAKVDGAGTYYRWYRQADDSAADCGKNGAGEQKAGGGAHGSGQRHESRRRRSNGRARPESARCRSTPIGDR